MSIGRVLVVDDEPPIRALVARVLERLDLSVDTAADGEEAISRLETGDYDVLVVDLMMPKVDGAGVIEFVKRMRGRRPTVIVASAGDSPTLHRLDSSVVHTILRKPFEIDVLGDLVAAAAQSARLQKQQKESSSIVPFRHNRG